MPSDNEAAEAHSPASVLIRSSDELPALPFGKENEGNIQEILPEARPVVTSYNRTPPKAVAKNVKPQEVATGLLSNARGALLFKPAAIPAAPAPISLPTVLLHHNQYLTLHTYHGENDDNRELFQDIYNHAQIEVSKEITIDQSENALEQLIQDAEKRCNIKRAPVRENARVFEDF